MALVKCHDCGNPISPNALMCPQCGVKPIKKTSIITWIIGAIFLIAVYQGCSLINKNSTQTPRSVSSFVAKAPNPCQATNFTVKGLRSRRDHDYTILVGTITNDGAVACGVQVKVSVYNKDGEVLQTKDPWPASIRNIAPGAGENFEVFMQFDRNIKSFNVVPIDAKAW